MRSRCEVKSPTLSPELNVHYKPQFQPNFFKLPFALILITQREKKNQF